MEKSDIVLYAVIFGVWIGIALLEALSKHDAKVRERAVTREREWLRVQAERIAERDAEVARRQAERTTGH